jgi:sugar lactone lactonase YvrE
MMLRRNRALLLLFLGLDFVACKEPQAQSLTEVSLALTLVGNTLTSDAGAVTVSWQAPFSGSSIVSVSGGPAVGEVFERSSDTQGQMRQTVVPRAAFPAGTSRVAVFTVSNASWARGYVDVTVPGGFSLSGTASGLATGKSVQLQLNGQEILTVSANGAFSFLTVLPDQTTYAVTVSTQPTGETCTVSNGSGTIASAAVNNIAVTCNTTGSTSSWTTLDLFAGQLGGLGNADDIGAAARLGGQGRTPLGEIAVDAAGTVYVDDPGAVAIRKITTDGTVSHLGGESGAIGTCPNYSNTDLAGVAYTQPGGLAVDAAGTTLYVTDCTHLDQIDLAAKTITTLSPKAGGAPVTFDHPGALALSQNGQRLFLVDNNDIWSIDLTQNPPVATALIANNAASDSGVSATAAPCAGAALGGAGFLLWNDATSQLYASEESNSVIDLLDLSGSCTVALFSNVLTAQQMAFNTLSAAPLFYVIDADDQDIWQVDSSGSATRAFGQHNGGNIANGNVSSVLFQLPSGLTMMGNYLYVGDGDSTIIRRLDLHLARTDASAVITLAGAPDSGGVQMPNAPTGSGTASPTQTLFEMPTDVVVDANGDIYVADPSNQDIKVFSPANGTFDLLPSSVVFSATALAVAGDGSVYSVAGSASPHSAIYKTAAGITTQIPTAGTANGYSEGASPKFNQPEGVLVYSGPPLGNGTTTWLHTGDLIVADTGNNVIRAVHSDLSATSWLQGSQSAASGFTNAANGWTNGDPTATQGASGNVARFDGPVGLAVSGSLLFIADQQNDCIRLMHLDTGVVSTAAGVCRTSGALDAAPASALFNQPQQIRLDSSGNLFIADSQNAAVRILTNAVSGAGANVETVVGALNGQFGVKLGPLPSRLNVVPSVAVATSGLYLLSESALLFAH